MRTAYFPPIFSGNLTLPYKTKPTYNFIQQTEGQRDTERKRYTERHKQETPMIPTTASVAAAREGRQKCGSPMWLAVPKHLCHILLPHAHPQGLQ